MSLLIEFLLKKSEKIMKKITEMTRPVVRAMRPEIEAALAEFAKSTGLEIELGNGLFSSTEVTFKVTAKLAGAESKEEKALSLFGYKPGQIVSIQGRKMKLVGYKSRNRKYPFIVKEMGAAGNGQIYKVSESMIVA